MVVSAELGFASRARDVLSSPAPSDSVSSRSSTSSVVEVSSIRCSVPAPTWCLPVVSSVSSSELLASSVVTVVAVVLVVVLVLARTSSTVE